MSSFLVVDDSPESLELMAYLLEAAGHGVRRAQTLAQALAEWRRARLDLVVCDLNLGGRSGVDFLRIVRAEPGGETLPIVAITAGAGRELALRAQRIGFDGFLEKPIDPRAFARELEGLLARTRPASALSGRRSASADAQGLAG